MLPKIREQEMIEEIIENLKLQAGLSLSPLQLKSLHLSKHIFSQQELKNHIKAITQYLKKQLMNVFGIVIKTYLTIHLS